MNLDKKNLLKLSVSRHASILVELTEYRSIVSGDFFSNRINQEQNHILLYERKNRIYIVKIKERFHFDIEHMNKFEGF